MTWADAYARNHLRHFSFSPSFDEAFCRWAAIQFDMRSSDDREAIGTAYDELEAAFDRVAALSYDALTSPELQNLLLRRERLSRRQPAVDHRLINQLTQADYPAGAGRFVMGQRPVDQAVDLDDRSAQAAL